MCAVATAAAATAFQASDAIVIDRGSSPLVTEVLTRVEAMFGLPRSHARAAQLLRYVELQLGWVFERAWAWAWAWA